MFQGIPRRRMMDPRILLSPRILTRTSSVFRGSPSLRDDKALPGQIIWGMLTPDQEGGLPTQRTSLTTVSKLGDVAVEPGALRILDLGSTFLLPVLSRVYPRRPVL
ncbi:hypothetical protein E4U53_001145 [Claviceps sorghi]|nr:hypothetical protein E4U53_001145 [Claviceps sorghi]